MNKFLLILGFIVLGGGAVFFIKQNHGFSLSRVSLSTQEVVTPTSSVSEQMENPQRVIEKFLENISKKNGSEAVRMMTKKIVSDDAIKQTWGVQFDAFQKLVVYKIEPFMKEEWTDMQQTYKVTMDVEMNENAVNNPIPYYGYDKGVNIRWISLVKEGTDWKIAGINTGP